MIAIGLLLVHMLCDCFRPRQQLEAELVVLRHQLNILQRQAPRPPHLRWVGRALFIWLYRRRPRIAFPGLASLPQALIAATVTAPKAFRSDRDFAAWTGLVWLGNGHCRWRSYADAIFEIGSPIFTTNSLCVVLKSDTFSS